MFCLYIGILYLLLFITSRDFYRTFIPCYLIIKSFIKSSRPLFCKIRYTNKTRDNELLCTRHLYMLSFPTLNDSLTNATLTITHKKTFTMRSDRSSARTLSDRTEWSDWWIAFRILKKGSHIFLIRLLLLWRLPRSGGDIIQP